jgi:hypothetical protein
LFGFLVALAYCPQALRSVYHSTLALPMVPHRVLFQEAFERCQAVEPMFRPDGSRLNESVG